MRLRKNGMTSDNAIIMPGYWIHRMWHTILQCPDYRVNLLYSSGTVGTKEPVHFTEYGGFRTSGVFIVHKHMLNAFGTKQSVRNIVDGHFSGVYVEWGSTARMKCFNRVLISVPVRNCKPSGTKV